MTAATRLSSGVFQDPGSWQIIAVVSLLATAIGVTATGHVDLCTSIGSLLLAVTWVALPVVTISTIVTIAALTPQTAERFVAAGLAVALTAAWTYALSWASVAQAIQGTTC